jgi:hypothetical protein
MKKVLVKLSAPVRIAGLLQRETFDVPLSDAGTRFMTWWDKAASDDRDTVLKLAHETNVCVTEALETLSQNSE